MKNLVLCSVLLCCACAKPIDQDAEKTAITKLLEEETQYATVADSIKWASCWLNEDESMFMYTTAEGATQFNSWNEIAALMVDAEPFELKLTRDHYNFSIGNDIAFVSFNQQDNWGGTEGRSTKESRTLQKVMGNGKS